MPHSTHHGPPPQHLRWSLGIHVAAYACVNAILALVDLQSGGSTWFYWPLLGWGIGLAYHAWAVGRRLGWWSPRTG
jgi:hypothetical protein